MVYGPNVKVHLVFKDLFEGLRFEQPSRMNTPGQPYPSAGWLPVSVHRPVPPRGVVGDPGSYTATCFLFAGGRFHNSCCMSIF